MSAAVVVAGCQTTAGPVDQSQLMLNRMGYNAGAVDGAYGGKTRAALEAFYTDNGGSFDGKLDANEVADLQAAMAERGIEVYRPLSSYEIERTFSVDPDKRDLMVTDTRHSRMVGQGVFWYGPQTAIGDWNNDGYDDIITVGVANVKGGNGQDYFPGGKCADYTKWQRVKDTTECKMDAWRIKPRIAWGAPGERLGYTMASDEMFIHDPAVGKPQGFEHAMDVLPADFNGDGIADFFVPDTGHNGNFDQYASLYLSNPDYTWTHSTFTHVKGVKNEFEHGANVGDIDSDGDIDIVTTRKGKGLACWMNNGDGTFVYKDRCYNGGVIAYTVSLADVDGDGDLDAFIGSNSYMGKGGVGKYNGGKAHKILLNNGRGQFKDHWDFPQIGCWVTSFKSETFDWDGDGDYDFVAQMTQDAYAFSALNLIENKGNGEWEQHLLVINDLDDVDPKNFWRQSYKIGHGNDTCGFYKYMGKTKTWEYNTWEGHLLNQSPNQYQFADADGDGRKDIILINPQAQEGWEVTRDRIHGGYFRNLGRENVDVEDNWKLLTYRKSSNVNRFRY